MSRSWNFIKEKFSEFRGWVRGPFSRWEALNIVVLLFLLAFTFFHVVNGSNDHDQTITLAIGLTFTAMLIGMVVWTHSYSWFSLSLIMLFFGDLMLYFFLADTYSGEDRRITGNTREYWVRAVRAAFTVGCNLMLINVFYLWKQNIRSETQEEE
jgi:hypothetical protein